MSIKNSLSTMFEGVVARAPGALESHLVFWRVRGYLAHKKTPLPLGPHKALGMGLL